MFAFLPPAARGEIASAARVDALGGQLFFRGLDGRTRSSAWSAYWLGTLGVALGADGLAGTASGQYLDRRQVTQVGGGGSLTTHTLDNTAALRWLHPVSPSWTLKPNVSYANESLTISAQEKLGAGVFDYHKFAGGLEAERKGETWRSIRQALNVYRVQYYHYEPARSPLSGLELLTDRRALDFRALEYIVGAERSAWPGGVLTTLAQVSFRDFPHQRIVEPVVFSKSMRHDLLASLILGVSHKAGLGNAALEGGLNLGASRLLSNQNDFDPAQLRFNSYFYSYREASGGPWVTIRVGDKATFSTVYAVALRWYDNRPLQDAQGQYITGRVHTETHAFTESFSYPLGGGLAASALASYNSSASNMRFEGAYRYNYSYVYYFAGLSWSR